ncbi:MAG: hypothetical protein FJ267_14330 [Planctomycetes bacterium]|nr:hypothetical protein [Planctomycetota bacterium]
MSCWIGRITVVIAILAHLWVNQIAVPLHHWTEHRNSKLSNQRDLEGESSSSRCLCHHHCRTVPSEGIGDQGQSNEKTSLPERDDQCPVCQVAFNVATSIESHVALVQVFLIETYHERAFTRLSSFELLHAIPRGPPVA